MSTTDPEKLSDEELLERIAQFDADEYPLAEHAERALQGQESEGES